MNNLKFESVKMFYFSKGQTISLKLKNQKKFQEVKFYNYIEIENTFKTIPTVFQKNCFLYFRTDAIINQNFIVLI